LTGLSAATIRRYLQILVNQGLLEKSGITKNTIYYAHDSLIF
jgi:iclR helix-turn-helix domain